MLGEARIVSDQVTFAIATIRDALDKYIFRATSEALLQDQVATLLESLCPPARFEREVPVHGGRFDILVHFHAGPDVARLINIVLELKLHARTAEVERQVQRYALMQDVDAVGVVTTSRRLVAGLMRPGDVGQAPAGELGGKPFFVIALRTT